MYSNNEFSNTNSIYQQQSIEIILKSEKKASNMKKRILALEWSNNGCSSVIESKIARLLFACVHINIVEYTSCTLSWLFAVSVTIFRHLHGLHHQWNRNVAHAMHASRLYAIWCILKIAQHVSSSSSSLPIIPHSIHDLIKYEITFVQKKKRNERTLRETFNSVNSFTGFTYSKFGLGNLHDLHRRFFSFFFI